MQTNYTKTTCANMFYISLSTLLARTLVLELHTTFKNTVHLTFKKI